MPTGSIVELYTSTLAWWLYEALWSLISTTGLMLVPFLFVTVKILLEAREGNVEPSAKDLTRVLETKLYMMVAVVIFACQPTINLYTANTTYTHHRCGLTDEGNLVKIEDERSFADSGTTYQDSSAAMIPMIEERIPRTTLWWYLSTRLSQATAQAAKQVLPCQPDIRLLAGGMSHLNINDLTLRQEVRHFTRDCYMPAANIFQRTKPPESEIPAAVRPRLAEDVSWIGSTLFMQRVEYYPTLRAKTAVSRLNFPYNEVRDADMLPPALAADIGPENEDMGFPYCDQWWGDEDNGLRPRLLESLRTELGPECENCLASWWRRQRDRWFGSQAESDEALLKATLTNVQLNSGSFGGHYDADMGWWEALKGVGGVIGLGIGTGKDAVKTEVMKYAGPIVQAMVLLVFVISLPIVKLLTGFDYRAVITLTILQFTIIFWGFWFELAMWLDNFMMASLLGSMSSHASVLGYLTNGRADYPVEYMVLNWIIRSLYVLLPLAFSYFLTGAGVRGVNNVFTGMSNDSKSLGNEGGRGVDTVQKIATRGK